jgi:hypothetical protein
MSCAIDQMNPKKSKIVAAMQLAGKNRNKIRLLLAGKKKKSTEGKMVPKQLTAPVNFAVATKNGYWLVSL